jgi:hypothetical protein
VAIVEDCQVGSIVNELANDLDDGRVGRDAVVDQVRDGGFQ